MKRNYYPNYKDWQPRPNSKSSKEREENKRVPSKICCMECGSTHGTLRKVKKPDGTKGYLCQYCFDGYGDEE